MPEIVTTSRFWIKADDISPDGSPATFVGVNHTYKDDPKHGKVAEFVATFKEFTTGDSQSPYKKFSLNKVNRETIIAMFGSRNTDNWIGKTITLYRTMVQNPAGAMVPGIRVKLGASQPAAAAPAPDFGAAATLGQAGETALMTALTGAGVSLDGLQDHLARCEPHNSAIYKGQPRNWPRSCSQTAKDYIAANSEPLPF